MNYKSLMDRSTCAIFLQPNVDQTVWLEFKSNVNKNTNAVLKEAESEGDRVGGEVENKGRAEGKGEGAVAAIVPHALALEAEGVTVVSEAESEGDRV